MTPLEAPNYRRPALARKTFTAEEYASIRKLILRTPTYSPWRRFGGQIRNIWNSSLLGHARKRLLAAWYLSRSTDDAQQVAAINTWEDEGGKAAIIADAKVAISI